MPLGKAEEPVREKCWDKLLRGPDSMQRMCELGIRNPKRHVSVKSLPSELTECCRKGGRKTVRARGDGGHQGNGAFWTQQGWGTYELRDWVSMHTVCGVCTNGVLELKGEDTCPIPDPEAVSDRVTLTKEMSAFSNRVSPGEETTLKGSSLTQQQMANTKRLSGVFAGSLSCKILSGFFPFPFFPPSF